MMRARTEQKEGGKEGEGVDCTKQHYHTES